MNTNNAFLKLMECVLLDTIYDGLSQKREYGKDWPERALTMIGYKRLNNIKYCLNNILADKIEGNIIETGVWRGGASIYIKAILKINDNDKKLYVADSFEGLPKPNPALYPHDRNDTHYTIDYLKVSQEEVINNFKKFDLLDSNVIFLKGWFKDTLPQLKNEKFSLLRLDGDMYESTMDSLNNLYNNLQSGGYIIIDDWCIPNCRQAVIDFRNKYNIQDTIIDIDGTGVFWRKQ